MVILACDEAGIAVTLPKPQTSRTKAEGRFAKPWRHEPLKALAYGTFTDTSRHGYARKPTTSERPLQKRKLN